ncbi:DUF4368 domain-containing protein [bacterium D16-54]|nr:DUF4368 domain-containing protein [bacterium D16-54]RKJ12714.1 DUF4368 domain-containing protein [bacterium D16-56]
MDRPTLLRLVKRIEVDEKYEIAGETHRDIKIYYNWFFTITYKLIKVQSKSKHSFCAFYKISAVSL